MSNVARMDKLHLISAAGVSIDDEIKHLQAYQDNVTYEHVPYEQFANGETKIQLKESVRGKKVFIFGDLYERNVVAFADRLIQLLLLEDTVSNHGAKSVRVINNSGSVNLDFLGPLDHKPVFAYPGGEDRSNKSIQETIKAFVSPEERVHIIGTQDTQQLTTDVVERLQGQMEHLLTTETIEYHKNKYGIPEVNLHQSTWGKHVYVMSDVNGNAVLNGFKHITYNERLIQAFMTQYEAWKGGAKSVSTIFTCFPYSRQDKPPHKGNKERVEREPSSAQMMDRILRGLQTDNTITVDMHNPSVIGSERFIDLHSGGLVEEVLRRVQKENIVMAPMDEGGLKKISAIAKDLQLAHITVIKTRDYSQSNAVEQINIYGDVEGKDILIHDDMLDTGGSMEALIRALAAKHPKSINIVVTHGMFNGKAIERLNSLHGEGLFERLFVANTIYREHLPDYVEQIDVAPLFSNTIDSIWQDKSINYNAWK